MILYVLTFKNGKKYVGITTKSFDARFKKHLEKTKKPKTKIQCALKYQVPCVEMADGYSSFADLCLAEKQEISRYNSYRNGYNGTVGGEGNISKRSQETKDKISRSKKGKIHFGTFKKGQPSPRKGKGEQIHGTYNSYKHYKCKCDLCKEAGRNYNKQYKNRETEVFQ